MNRIAESAALRMVSVDGRTYRRVVTSGIETEMVPLELELVRLLIIHLEHLKVQQIIVLCLKPVVEIEI